MPLAASTALLERLSGAGEVLTDPDLLGSYRFDQAAPGLLEAGTPAAVVRPTDTAQVAAAVRAAAAAGVPVVPRGAGSGLSGGANAIDGCLVLSLERMTRIVEVDRVGMTATVEAGVINDALGEAAAGEGLFYAPDPASHEFSTIGGNVATNAGGLCCVKYGVTRDAVLALEVVRADGTIVRIGRPVRKDVAGYDLTGVLCGSEGTLAVITAATVKLLPLPGTVHTLAASFSDLEAAGQAILRICRRGRPSMLELMDRATIAAVEAMAPMDLDPEAEAMVFAQSDAGRLQGAEEIAAFEKACEEVGADLVVTTDEAAEGRLLTAARRLAYPALERRGATILDDVGVPLAALPALLRGVASIAAEGEVEIGTFGHAGDGNMHPTIVYDHRDAEQVAGARRAFESILALALKLDGTITGEHGVGVLKRGVAGRALTETASLQVGIKRAFDPDALFNPGKLAWE